MPQVFFQVVWNTFRECVREPVYLVLLTLSLALNGLVPAFALFVFRSQEKLVRDSDMATMMMFGMITAVLCASNTVSREIRNSTALLVLSKPVNRPLFISAKVVGVSAVMLLFCILNGLSTLIALRVAVDQFRFDELLFWGFLSLLLLSLVYGAGANYMTRKNFSQQALLFMSITIPLWAIFAHFRTDHAKVVGLDGETAKAVFLLTLSILAMGVISTALSTVLNFVGNLTVSSFIFMLGLMSPYFFGIEAKDGNVISQIIYAIIPNWQQFWMADAISLHKEITFSFIMNAFTYFCLLVSIFLITAILLFQDREIGNNNAR